MLTYLPAVRLQALDNTGRLLESGKVYTYELGTTTPKDTYRDIYGQGKNTNPIILDDIGSASIYLKGAYTLWLYDEHDVQLGPPVDILGGINDFIGGGVGTFANDVVVSVDTYASVRAIQTPYAWVFVQGRTANADGGQGLFCLDLSNTSQDDDGITLDPQTTGRYVRYDVQSIDPRWFGLVYDSNLDQSIYLQASETASKRYARVIKVDGSVYINSDYTTSESQYIFSNKSKVISTLSVKYNFKSNTKLLKCGRRVWSNYVTPIFADYSTDHINYSWFNSDNIEGNVTKMLSCTSASYRVDIDEQIVTTNSIIFPDNYQINFPSTSTSASIIFKNPSTNLTIKSLSTGSQKVNCVKFDNYNIGTLNIPFQITPDFFCYNSGALSGNDHAMLASHKAGNILVDTGKSYTTTSAIVANNDVYITGKGSIIYNNDISVIRYNVTDTNIYLVSASLTVDTYTNLSKMTLETFGTNTNLLSIADISNTTFSTDTTFEAIASINNFVYYPKSSPKAVLSNVVKCIDSTFYGLSGTTFTGLINNTNILSTSSSNQININNITANGLFIKDSSTLPKVFLKVSGTNIINNSTFDSDYDKCMTNGLGSVKYFGCTFGPNVIRNSKYTSSSFFGCRGGFVEANGYIDSVTNDRLVLSSTTYPTDFACVSGTWTGSTYTPITATSPYTVTSNTMTFTTSGYYDYILKPLSAYNGISGTASAKCLVKVTNDDQIKLFKTFGGTLSVSASNIGKSRFKVVAVYPDLNRSNADGLVTPTTLPMIISAGSVSASKNKKVIAETPYISDNITVDFDFNTFVNNVIPTFQNVNPFYYWHLTDNLGLRDRTVFTNAPSATLNDYIDFAIIGFVDSGTVLKMSVTPSLPMSDKVSDNYRTTYSGFWLTSGLNSNWIQNPSCNLSAVTGNKLITSANDVYKVFEQLGDSQHYGFFADSYKMQTYNPYVMQDTISIKIFPIMSGEIGRFFVSGTDTNLTAFTPNNGKYGLMTVSATGVNNYNLDAYQSVEPHFSPLDYEKPFASKRFYKNMKLWLDD